MLEEDKRKVAVFGAGGILGREIVDFLDCEPNIEYRSFTREQCDITEYKEVFDAIGGEKDFTHVINCAAYTDVDGCEENKEKADAVNNKAIEYLSKLCLDGEIHLTHISTDYVFDGTKKEPYIEPDSVNPLSVYGSSKLAGEGHIRMMGDKGLIIRTSWLYGNGSKNFINSALVKLQKGLEIKAIEDQVGSPTYVVDLANVIIQLSLSRKYGLFHVSNSGSCTWYEFIKKAAELCEFKKSKIKPIKMGELKRKAMRPRNSILANIRLDQTLADPLRNWDSALEQYLYDLNLI